jgi:Uri superfamily endonuclease
MRDARVTSAPVAPRAEPGTYVIVLRADHACEIGVGRLGVLPLRAGYYAYVGSAFGPGGVRARLARHCRGSDRRHWHVDYLRARTRPAVAWYSHDRERLEHRWSDVLGKLCGMTAIPGFGCTDCRCASHLFYSVRMPAHDAFVAAAPGHIERCDCAVF